MNDLVEDPPARAEEAAPGTAGESQAGMRQSLAIAALGVVYGDIGTSPLYTMKQCFDGVASVTEPRVFGVLSLIVWTLTVVVTLKYVIVLMRADNRGEGGILALMALALRATIRGPNRWVLWAGLCGAALFYGDSVLTPAITVLGAVEGLEVQTPELAPYVIPLTILLLAMLFIAQRRGTGRVGGLFGPIIIVWFAVIGLLGLREIVRHPMIMWALNPWYGIDLIRADPASGFVLLGAVVLAVTGAEALYADMGHFGRGPIRRAWLRLVFPALLLNYFGQGALLLARPEAIQNPFYLLAPEWAVLPLVVLAAMASVIASQAVISGAFSLTSQAVQLGFLPRMNVRHTSDRERGQVYVPAINNMLLVAVAATVLGFRSSDALGSAYGIAVTGTMTVTTILAFTHLRRGAHWPLWRLIPLFVVFITVDVSFFSANLLKVADGGWYPLVIALGLYAVMMTWIWGRGKLAKQRASSGMPLDMLIASLRPDRPVRVPGTAIYMTAEVNAVPAALLHNMKHNKVLHERTVLMTVQTADVPRMLEANRLDIRHFEQNFHTVRIRYGFAEEPDIPRALALCRVGGFRFNLMETSFFVGHEKIVPTRRTRWLMPFKRLFVLLSELALDATEFFRIPVNRVVELGGQVEI